MLDPSKHDEENGQPGPLADTEQAGMPPPDHGILAFDCLFNTSPMGLLLVDGRGLIVRINARALAMFGYEEAELVGEPIETLLPHRARPHHVAIREGYIAAPSIRAMGKGRDLTGRRKDGIEFPLEIGLSPLTTQNGMMTCASIVDITERKRAELRLREANAQLEEFTYVASHDLRSPMRGIANLINIIREDYGEQAPPAVLHNLGRMEERVNNTEKIISDLLHYARAGRRAIKAEPIVLADLIAEVVETESPPPGMTITVEASDDEFEGVRTPLTTILRNLLSNAIKHHDRETGTITLRARLEGNSCLFDVCDDGPGIPEASQGRVFRLFQTLSAAQRKGTGLGLAVVQRLVESHGGSITLLSQDGKRGCTFRVTWPRFARTDLDD